VKDTKRKRLEKRGWKVGHPAELLNLSPEELHYAEIKLALSRTLREHREKSDVSQEELARRLHSSASRVAKMEACDPSVTIDLLVRTLLALGASPKIIGKAIQSAQF
jgi:ribosome-binding protein aMBF1 (putative translation factor)